MEEDIQRRIVMKGTLSFVWKETIYKNRFKCECGNQLADPETGYPSDHVLVDMDNESANRKFMFCDKCRKPVCMIQEVMVAEDVQPGLKGSIEEMKKMENEGKLKKTMS